MPDFEEQQKARITTRVSLDSLQLSGLGHLFHTYLSHQGRMATYAYSLGLLKCLVLIVCQ